jgi:hypothetical protein
VFGLYLMVKLSFASILRFVTCNTILGMVRSVSVSLMVPFSRFCIVNTGAIVDKARKIQIFRGTDNFVFTLIVNDF